MSCKPQTRFIEPVRAKFKDDTVPHTTDQHINDDNTMEMNEEEFNLIVQTEEGESHNIVRPIEILEPRCATTLNQGLSHIPPFSQFNKMTQRLKANGTPINKFLYSDPHQNESDYPTLRLNSPLQKPLKSQDSPKKTYYGSYCADEEAIMIHSLTSSDEQHAKAIEPSQIV